MKERSTIIFHQYSLKKKIAQYDSGLYLVQDLSTWSQTSYTSEVTTKLDMDKSCIKWKNSNHTSYSLITELATKLSVEKWIHNHREE